MKLNMVKKNGVATFPRLRGTEHETLARLAWSCLLALVACGPSGPRLARVMPQGLASDVRCTRRDGAFELGEYTVGEQQRRDVMVVGQVERPTSVDPSHASTLRDAVRAGGGLLPRATIMRVRWCDSSGLETRYYGRIRELTECDWSMQLPAGAEVIADLDEDD